MPETRTSETSVAVQTTTTVASPVAIMAAIKKADDILQPSGGSSVWKAFNSDQERFLALYEQFGGKALDFGFIDAVVGMDVRLVNQWLAAHGFGIQLDPLPTDGRGLAAASILDLLVKWREIGQVDKVTHQNRMYPAFRLNNGVGFHRVDGHPHLVVSIETQSDCTVFITMNDQHPGDGLDLFDRSVWLAANLRAERSNYKGVIAPMVKFDIRPNIDSLTGLQTVGEDGRLAKLVQMLMQAKFKMNHIGAHAQVAAAAGIMRCMSIPAGPYTIDKPFTMWMKVPQMSIPVFVAHVTPESWVDPISL